jgi:hypothetical protein
MAVSASIAVVLEFRLTAHLDRRRSSPRGAFLAHHLPWSNTPLARSVPGPPTPTHHGHPARISPEPEDIPSSRRPRYVLLCIIVILY